MTAGRGVVHAEMPGGEGVQRGISIWINLSSKDKMYVLLHRRHLLALCLEFC
jgi:redox-sensitive bicupin YhaK (pirin superfamily)